MCVCVCADSLFHSRNQPRSTRAVSERGQARAETRRTGNGPCRAPASWRLSKAAGSCIADRTEPAAGWVATGRDSDNALMLPCQQSEATRERQHSRAGCTAASGTSAGERGRKGEHGATWAADRSGVTLTTFACAFRGFLSSSSLLCAPFSSRCRPSLRCGVALVRPCWIGASSRWTPRLRREGASPAQGRHPRRPFSDARAARLSPPIHVVRERGWKRETVAAGGEAAGGEAAEKGGAGTVAKSST